MKEPSKAELDIMIVLLCIFLVITALIIRL